MGDRHDGPLRSPADTSSRLSDVDHRRGEVVVPYSKDQVKDAPSVDPDGQLSHEEEYRLYEHYGIAPARDSRWGVT